MSTHVLRAGIDELAFQADRAGPYVARSASARDPNWPYWFVHGADGVNCLRFDTQPLALFMPREVAEECARILNGEVRP